MQVVETWEVDIALQEDGSFFGVFELPDPSRIGFPGATTFFPSPLRDLQLRSGQFLYLEGARESQSLC